MSALRDFQKSVRDTLTLGDASGLESQLVGGRDPRKRLAIHQRHYSTSLITSLLDRFPATVWLVGSPFVADAAREFIRLRPPSRPCLAEYGEEFPAFLAARPGAVGIAYLRQFAELEWHLSRLSLAVETPALTMADLSTIDPATLGDAKVALQSGVHYLHADWAIDELISLYLSDSAPDHFSLQPGDVWLELRGARGELRMNRLSHANFAFRAALVSGESITDAAASALEIDTAFEAGQALLDVVGERLVVVIHAQNVGGDA